MCDYPDSLLWSDDCLCSGPGSKPVCHDYGEIMVIRSPHSVMRNREGKADTQIKCKMFGQGPGINFVFRLYLF